MTQYFLGNIVRIINNCNLNNSLTFLKSVILQNYKLLSSEIVTDDLFGFVLEIIKYYIIYESNL